MSRKHNIDRQFCKKMQNHEEKYDPRDWEKMHTILQKEGLVKTGQSRYTKLVKLFSRTLYTAALFLLLLIPSGMNKYPLIAPATGYFSTLRTQDTSINPEYQEESLEFPLLQKKEIIPQQSPAFAQDQQNTPTALSKTPTILLTQVLPVNNSQKNVEMERKGVQESLRDPRQQGIASISSTQTLRFDDHYFLKTYLFAEFAALETRREHEVLHHSDDLTRAVLNPVDDIDSMSIPWHKELQFGLTYPVSNQGKNSLQQRNRVAVNAIIGRSAGLKGFEISGLGNLNQGEIQGMQVAGVFNHSRDSLKGMQLSSALNISGGQDFGVQVSGLMNVSGKKEEKSETYAPVADTRKFKAQVSGIGNIDYIGVKHVQASGLFNIAPQVKGVQLSGLVNVADNVRGVQLGGLVNVSHQVKGVQIGLINIADSLDGVAIGLINVVKKNAYRKLEFWGTETFHTNIGFKLGTRKFYNIFALGSQINPATFRWGLGYGFGTQLQLHERSHLDLDLIVYHVNEDRKLTRVLNLLTQFKASFAKELGSGIALFGGPTVNFLMSDFKNSDNSIGSQIAPWTFYQNVTKERGTKIKLWGGLNFGISF